MVMCIMPMDMMHKRFYIYNKMEHDDEVLTNLGYKPTFKGMYKYVSGDGKTKETELVMERKYCDDKKLCSYCKNELPTDAFGKVTVARYLKGKKMYVKVYYRNCYCRKCYYKRKKDKLVEEEDDD